MRTHLFLETLLQILACSEDSNNKNRFCEIETDFDPKYTKKLRELLEIDSEIIEIRNNDYKVQVRLKDDSFAPRRFAHGEKAQIQEITNDLLNRGIIKRSNSPYCAWVVPVRKKRSSTLMRRFSSVKSVSPEKQNIFSLLLRTV